MIETQYIRGKGQVVIVDLYQRNLLVSSLKTTLRKREKDLSQVTRPELRVLKINEIDQLKKLITAYESLAFDYR